MLLSVELHQVIVIVRSTLGWWSEGCGGVMRTCAEILTEHTIQRWLLLNVVESLGTGLVHSYGYLPDKSYTLNKKSLNQPGDSMLTGLRKKILIE